jgi:membrane dipeptidase
MPEGLEDVSGYPGLFEELASRGYGDEDLMKIAGRNVLRVMRDAERTAARLRAQRPPSKATIEELDRA